MKNFDVSFHNYEERERERERERDRERETLREGERERVLWWKSIKKLGALNLKDCSICEELVDTTNHLKTQLTLVLNLLA